jgi:hypothetical protein
MTTPSVHLVPAPFRTLEEGVRIDPVCFPGCASLKGVDGAEVEESLRTQFCCFRGEESLTVVFSAAGSACPGHSALIGPAEMLRTPGLWNLSEVVEVFAGADARATGQYREYEVAPDGRWIALDVQTDASGMRGDQHSPTGFRCAVAWQRGLWRAALEIPWSDLGGAMSVVHGNFFRSIPGRGDEGLFAWSPTGTGAHCFHRPERFGELL